MKVGDRVFHFRHGAGTIEAEGSPGYVRVRFDHFHHDSLTPVRVGSGRMVPFIDPVVMEGHLSIESKYEDGEDTIILEARVIG